MQYRQEVMLVVFPLYYYRVSQKRTNIFTKFSKSHTLEFITMSCRR